MRTYNHLVWMTLGVLAILSMTGCAGKETNTANVPERQDDFDRSADRAPTPRTLYATARILAARGDEAPSKAILMRIIREHKNFLPAYCDLSELYMRRRETEKAIEVLMAGLNVSPGDPVLLNNVGMCWIVKGQYDKALTYFTAAAAKAPMDAKYRANMAVALGLQGRYDESLALFGQVVSTSEAHFNVAVLCEARKDFVLAKMEYDLARQARPTTAPAATPMPTGKL